MVQYALVLQVPIKQPLKIVYRYYWLFTEVVFLKIEYKLRLILNIRVHLRQPRINPLINRLKLTLVPLNRCALDQRRKWVLNKKIVLIRRPSLFGVDVQNLTFLQLFTLQALYLTKLKRTPRRFLLILGITTQLIQISHKFLLQIRQVRYLNRMPILFQETDDNFIFKYVDIRAQNVHVF